MAEFIESVPEVRADGGMVYANCERTRFVMSPHMALVLAGALREAAYAAMDRAEPGRIGPVFIREDYRED